MDRKDAVDGKQDDSANGPTEIPETMSAGEAYTEVSKQKPSVETFDEATTDEVERRTTNDDIEKDKEAHPFSRKTWKEDLALVVEGNKLYVSKTILGMYSPVFNEMFEEDPVFEIMGLHNKTYDSVLEFLSCLYPKIRKPVTVQNLHLVMPLALEYQTDCLITECKSVITNNATKSAPCDVLLQLIQLCQSLKLHTLEDLCWKAVREKDVGGIAAMEGICKDTEVKIKLLTIKSENLKRTVREYALKTSKLQMERDSLDGILRFLMGNLEGSEQQEVASVRGGDFCTILVNFEALQSTRTIKHTGQSDHDYEISFSTRGSVLFVEFSTKKYYSTVKGRLTIENRVSPNESRSFRFFYTFSQSKNTVLIRTLPFTDIIDVTNGYLIQSEGSMVFEFISKR